MANLPTGIPRLDALVRAEAGQQTAGLLYHLERGIKARIDSATSDAQRVYWQSALDDIPPAVAVIDAFESLLRDLSRRESRDWATTTLAELVGIEVGNTAPSWEASSGGRWGLDVHRRGFRHFGDHGCTCSHGIAVPGISALTDPAEALALALAAVCRDG